MAVTYQASGALLGATTTNDVTPANPAHLADDILICITANRVVTNTCATPSGWTLLVGPVDETAWRSYVFWKRATSGAETNPLCDWTATSADKYAQVHSIRGATTSGSPFAASAWTDGATDPAVATGVTTTAASQRVFSIGLCADNLSTSATVTATDPASFTAHSHTVIATGADATGFIYSAVRATAGATGNVSHDFSAAPLHWGILVAALTEAAVPPVSGTGLGAFTFGSAAAGFPTKQGQAAGAYTFTAAASGSPGAAPPVEGQALGAYTFTGTTAGVRETTGQAAAALSFTATSAGTVTVQGVGASAPTFTAAATGVRTVNAQAAAPLTFTATASGVPTVYGQALGALAFTATAAGVVQGASVEVFGTGLGAYTFTAAAAGGPPAGPSEGPYIRATRTGRRVTTTRAGRQVTATRASQQVAATYSGAVVTATPMGRQSERA